MARAEAGYDQGAMALRLFVPLPALERGGALAQYVDARAGAAGRSRNPRGPVRGRTGFRAPPSARGCSTGRRCSTPSATTSPRWRRTPSARRCFAPRPRPRAIARRRRARPPTSRLLDRLTRVVAHPSPRRRQHRLRAVRAKDDGVVAGAADRASSGWPFVAGLGSRAVGQGAARHRGRRTKRPRRIDASRETFPPPPPGSRPPERPRPSAAWRTSRNIPPRPRRRPHVRRKLQGANRGDQPFPAPADVLCGEHDLGGGGKRVPSSGHRHRAGVPGLSSSTTQRASRPRWPPRRRPEPLPVRARAPLDVHLEIPGELRRRRPRPPPRGPRPARIASATVIPSASTRPSHSRSKPPVFAAEPRYEVPKRVPSSSANADHFQVTGVAPPAARRSTTASAARIPSGPVVRPAFGTVSMGEPRTNGGPRPPRPITLPTASRRTVSPASSIQPVTSSPARASASVAKRRVSRPGSSLISPSAAARARTPAAVPYEPTTPR